MTQQKSGSKDSKSFENNIASHLPRMSALQPDAAGIIFPQGKGYTTWTYAEVNARSDVYASIMRDHGINPGDKVLLMLKAGPELIVTVFALFKMGALPVVLDPGMGKKQMLRCIAHVAPDYFIGIPLAHMARVLNSSAFTSVKKNFTAQGWFPGTTSLAKLAKGSKRKFETVPVSLNDTAAILFTSGSTGPAKGVIFTHGMFQGQLKYLKKLLHFEPGEIDVPGYPMFALFDLALGMTSVIPRLDPSKPAACDPSAIVNTIIEFDATTCQGSPAIWRKVGTYCREEEIELPSLKRVITFGAPVAVDLLRTWKENILSENADVYTPYGATESLPVALMKGSEVLAETAELTSEGAGTCVGMPVHGLQVKIIRISDDPIEKWSDDLEVAPGEVGEITVHGEVVTQSYYKEPEANKLAKIDDGRGHFWHRMGDLGYFDNKGRLWFCGRKAHRVETAKGLIFPVQAEGMANCHPSVFRSALVGLGKRGQQRPILLVQLKPRQLSDDDNKKEELLKKQILARFTDTEKFSEITELQFMEDFPVDPRHNVKIHREEMAAWLEEQGF